MQERSRGPKSPGRSRPTRSIPMHLTLAIDDRDPMNPIAEFQSELDTADNGDARPWGVEGEPFSDAELAALALSEDLDQPVSPSAVAWRPSTLRTGLPGWYMPAPCGP